MKSRLSLTIDPKVTHRSKRYARKENKSLSALVEELLDRASTEQGHADGLDEASFSQRWSGQLKASGKSDMRFRHLSKKYDLE